MRLRTLLTLCSLILPTILLAQKTPAPTLETVADFGGISLGPGQSVRLTVGIISPRDSATPVTVEMCIYSPSPDGLRWQIVDRRSTRVTLQMGELAVVDYLEGGIAPVIVRPFVLIEQASLPADLVPVIELREGGKTLSCVPSMIVARKGAR